MVRGESFLVASILMQGGADIGQAAGLILLGVRQVAVQCQGLPVSSESILVPSRVTQSKADVVQAFSLLESGILLC